MTLFNYIHNKTNETLKNDVRTGYANCSVIRHISIYVQYDYYRNAGEKKSEAVHLTAYDFRTSKMTVYKVINQMEAEI